MINDSSTIKNKKIFNRLNKKKLAIAGSILGITSIALSTSLPLTSCDSGKPVDNTIYSYDGTN
jgi:hypothetical protein